MAPQSGQPLQPPQHQDRQPGVEGKMTPRPQAKDPAQRGSGKLQDKVALISGGDSGIGRAVAIAFAREGADSVILYLNEHQDAKKEYRKRSEYDDPCVAVGPDVLSESAR